jgi:hypothetical protein
VAGPTRQIIDAERGASVKRPGLQDVWPLSPLQDVWPESLQQGLFFHAQFGQEGVDGYTVQHALDLAGPVDAGALQAAAQVLVDRPANLRTSFWHPRSGPPVQVIAGELALPWRDVDLTGLEAVNGGAAWPAYSSTTGPRVATSPARSWRAVTLVHTPPPSVHQLLSEC